ncbi:MAG: Fur family transcriptional regulator [Lagierella massiliensis]|nr:Fur family transcriptional regulator [Lagierella massiliensis]
MEESYFLDFLKETLMKVDIRPTFQRLKILEYLQEYRNHPTVDDIYKALSPNIPTLSKTTIYNTLSTFKESGIVNEVNIDGVETKYDIVTSPHGHFNCIECGELTDFDCDFEAFKSKDLQNHKILKRNFFIQGICPSCLKKITQKEKDVQ